MDTRFSIHNTHLEAPDRFRDFDPQLRRLDRQKYVYNPPLLESLPWKTPGIYTLGGGRQIGKTTLMKQWMEKLMSYQVQPEAIAFFSGEIIDDHHALIRLLQSHLSHMPINTLSYILLDEVTYIRDWDKAIKYLADSGLLENVFLLVTGSDLTLIQEARMRFPGRRGKADVVNFHLYPLSFREVVHLKHDISERPDINLLFKEFDQYLIHGGYLTAINDFALHNKILDSSLMTYSDWVRGDMLKRGKQENYLKEILQAMIKRYGTQISWNSLAKDLSIDHPKTVSDYIALLESMDAVFVQSAILEDKLVAAPKKAKKVMFTDPFIFHAMRSWLYPVKSPYLDQIQPFLNDAIQSSQLVEACVITQYRRLYPTYYIKGEGEVDISYVDQDRFWPIEIKWTQQLREKDLKQILKYPNGRIFNKAKTNGQIQHIPTQPLPEALWELGG